MLLRNPITGVVCCARVASGQAAALPMNVMKSRRCMAAPIGSGTIVPTTLAGLEGLDVRFGLPAQPIDATHALNLSAGVSNLRVLRGRSLTDFVSTRPSPAD